MITLKEHNIRPYEELCTALSNSNRALYTSATGTGKSYVAGKYIEDYIGEEHCLILTPALTINESWRKILPDAQILTYQSLLINTPSLQDVKCIICDEAHHLGAELWGQKFEDALKNYQGKVLGLSATPIRYLDNYRDMGLEMFEGNIVKGLTIGEAVNEGILPSFHYISSMFRLSDYVPKIPTNKENETTSRLLGQLDYLNSEESIQNILKKHFTSEQKTIVFCPNIKSCYEIKNIISKEYPNATHSFLHSGQGKTKRKDVLNDFDTTSKRVFLYVVDVLNEGVHVKGADSIIMLRKTSSPTVFVQQLGRALDVGSGKENILVFDFVGNLSGVKGKKNLLSMEAQCIKDIQNFITNPEKHIVVDDYLTEQQSVLRQLQIALGYAKEEWTVDEIEILKNEHSIGCKALSFKVNHSSGSIQKKLEELGLTTPHKAWTKEEDNCMRQFWMDKSTRHLCYEKCSPNHTELAIRARAKTLGLVKKDLLWTKEEYHILRTYYPKENGIEECVKRLPTRSRDTIKTKAHSLGLLHKKTERHRWTQEELKIIQDTMHLPIQEVKKRLPKDITEKSIIGKRRDFSSEKRTLTRWSQEDILILKETMDLPLKEVQKLLSREVSLQTITDKRCALRKQQRLSESQSQESEELNNAPSFMTM